MKKEGGTRAWKTCDGIQLMQSQARKTGRMLTSRRGTDKKRRMTLTAHPLQGSASAKWLLLNEPVRVSRSASVSPCCNNDLIVFYRSNISKLERK